MQLPKMINERVKFRVTQLVAQASIDLLPSCLEDIWGR